MDRIEREQLLNSQIKIDDEYAKVQQEKKKEFYQNLRNMHQVNIQTEKHRLDAQRRAQFEVDKHSLETRLKQEKDETQRRANSRIEMQKRNAEYEKKVAMAARAITYDRDNEKEKLTMINIDKTQAR